jgi:hypothetical protein
MKIFIHTREYTASVMVRKNSSEWFRGCVTNWYLTWIMRSNSDLLKYVSQLVNLKLTLTFLPPLTRAFYFSDAHMFIRGGRRDSYIAVFPSVRRPPQLRKWSTCMKILHSHCHRWHWISCSSRPHMYPKWAPPSSLDHETSPYVT